MGVETIPRQDRAHCVPAVRRAQGTDNAPPPGTDEVGEPGKPDRQGMQSCCRPGSVCHTSGTRETIGEDCRSGQKEVRKRSERGLEEAREPVGTRQDRTLLPVPDALRTTFRKRDVRAFERGGSAKGGSAKGAPAAKGFRQGSRLRRPPEQAYRGLAREDVRRSAQKKTGHEIWPRVCLKTGAQALLLLSGRHICSPWHGYGPAFSATVTCSFFQMAFRHSPLFLSRGLED